MQLRPAGRDGRQRAASTSTSSRTSPASTARRRRSCPSRSSWTTAPACTSTRRCGRTARTSSPARGYAGLSDMACTPSAACCGTPRPCAPSPTRRPTATSGWCPATRRRSTSPTAAAIARRRSASRSTRPTPKAKRIEFRCPTASGNPYLAFAAMLMAMLDGIKNKIKPRSRSTRTSTTWSRRSGQGPDAPGSLEEALNNLEERPRLPPPRATCSPEERVGTLESSSSGTGLDAGAAEADAVRDRLYYDC